MPVVLSLKAAKTAFHVFPELTLKWIQTGIEQ